MNFKTNVERILDLDYGKTVKTADKIELYNAVSKAAMSTIQGRNGLEAEGKKVLRRTREPVRSLLRAR